MASELLKQTDIFMQAFETVPNPTPPLLLDAFCESMQATGRDLGEFSEDEWRESFRRMGYSPGRHLIMLEQVASWGIVDVDTWIDPASAALVAEAQRAK